MTAPAMEVTPGKGEHPPTALVICVNRRFGTDRPSCAGRGSEELADSLERMVAARHLAVSVDRIRCFGDCARGAVMRLYPNGPFYRFVGPDDLRVIVAEIERLCGQRLEGDTPPPARLQGS